MAQAGNETSANNSMTPAERMPAYVPNTPEADGRPGQYYYILGAQAFKNRDYAHAVSMYQVAASWAYKPAEFNLGVMYARGQGIPVDLPRAMAWMTLAAERNEPSYVKARELVRANLDADQLAESETILQQLTPRYGDKVALRRAKRRWSEVRSSMTGSRVGSMAGNMVSGTPKAGPATPNPKFSVGQVVPVTGAAATGGQNSDGSLAYQQLVSSNNPYDPKFMTPVGTTTVGPLTPVKHADKAHEPSKPAKTDSGNPR
ncbi:MAG TPA: sel1 repeat family protein [Rhodanobacter sp.]|nr:sel1 repeat family protein [Rhodanobacter sp.]